VETLYGHELYDLEPSALTAELSHNPNIVTYAKTPLAFFVPCKHIEETMTTHKIHKIYLFYKRTTH